MKEIKYILAIILMVFISSCNENEFLTEEPRDDVYADNLFLSYDGFNSSLNAAYAMMRHEYARMSSNESRAAFGDPKSIAIATHCIWTLCTDNMFMNNGYSSFNWANWPHTIYTDGEAFEVVFLWLYRVVNTTNMIIERAENPDIDWQGVDATEDERNKNYILAQAKFIRAWAYRHLTYTWGDVPLSTVEISGTTYRSDWSRSSVAEVRAQMEEDLLFAKNNLNWKYDNPSVINRAAAQHFLAELYLATGDYGKAVSEAKDVIDNSGYKLVTERFGNNASNPGNCYIDMFRSPLPIDGNTESLLVFLNTEEENVTSGFEPFSYMRYMYSTYYSKLKNIKTKDIGIFYTYNGGRGGGRASITPDAYDWWEDGDIRFDGYSWRKVLIYPNESDPNKMDTIQECWMDIKTDPQYYMEKDDYYHTNANAWPSTAKWDYVHPIPASATNTPNFNDMPYLRLAETYLVLAEGQLMNGNQTEAATTINVLRARANATPVSASEVDIDYILDERSRELFSEEERRHHLVRTGKFIERVKEHNIFSKYHIKDHNVLLPIPQKVIDANTDAIMEQNPGY